MLPRRHAGRRKWTWTCHYRLKTMVCALAAAANQLRRDADARANSLDRLARGGPEIPLRAEQVDLHSLAACPGVPEFLRVERAFGGGRDLVELDAEVPAEDHRQHVP